jgi:hypothetical protein
MQGNPEQSQAFESRKKCFQSRMGFAKGTDTIRQEPCYCDRLCIDCQVFELTQKSKISYFVGHRPPYQKYELEFSRIVLGIERRHPLEIDGPFELAKCELFKIGKVVSAIAIFVFRRERRVIHESPERGREDIEVNVRV